MIEVLLAAGQALAAVVGFVVAGYGAAVIVRNRPLNPEQSSHPHGRHAATRRRR